MMDRHLRELLNDQFNKELYSAYLYMDFADYYHNRGLHGFGNWYDVQVQEERDHAMLMRAWMLKRGETIELLPIAKPDKTITDDADPLHFALAHEQYVTGLIHTSRCHRGGRGHRQRRILKRFSKSRSRKENATR